MSSLPPTLIQRMLSGDRHSYDEIVSAYSEDVYRLCILLLQDRDEAKDILQEALLRLVRNVQEGKFRQVNGSIRGFLICTARNLCIDRLKIRRRFLELPEENDSSDWIDTNTPPPDRVSDDRRFEMAFDRALTQLNPIQRTILVLHEINEESYEQIAQTLNLTVNNVRTHLWRAREKMRLILEPFWRNR